MTNQLRKTARIHAGHDGNSLSAAPIDGAAWRGAPLRDRSARGPSFAGPPQRLFGQRDHDREQWFSAVRLVRVGDRGVCSVYLQPD